MKISLVKKFCCVLFLALSCACNQNPLVNIETKFGNIECEIYVDEAPVTAGNFLKYVDEGRFEGATFYRTVTLDNQSNSKVKIEVLQGGLFEDVHPRHLPAIEHETTKKTGIIHKDGVISMARLEPGSAMADFFICIGDQPELDFGGNRNPDGQGFAAFGKVINGMEVVKKMQRLEQEGQYLVPPVIIDSIRRIN